MAPQFATQQDVENVRQDLRDHTIEDKDFQKRMFEYLNKRFDKLDTLWDKENQRQGEENSQKKTEEEKGKIMDITGWAINAFIGAVTAIATVKLIK